MDGLLRTARAMTLALAAETPSPDRARHAGAGRHMGNRSPSKTGQRTADEDASAGAFRRLTEPADDLVVDVVGVIDLQVMHPLPR